MSTSVAMDAPSAAPGERPIKLPRAEPAASPVADALTPEDARNPMFELLVRNETDVAGLLAYSLYKQNKRDWLISFQAAHGRPPVEAETEAFILGERIARRTTTYRLLAEDMLRSGEPAKPGRREAAMPAPTQARAQSVAEFAANDAGRPAAQAAAKRSMNWRQIGLLLLALVAMAIVFRLVGAWLFR